MELRKKDEVSARRDIKILVVDDREDNLFSIEAILERDGYTLVKANSGRAALKILLQEHDFTLILMDVQMPDMDGFETANLIYERERLRHIPIIFITAHNHDAQYIFKGYQMGGVDYIYKPINSELLRAKVRVFAELSNKTHQLMVQEKALKAVNRSLKKEVEERKTNEEKIKLLNHQLIENNTNLKLVNEELNRFAYVASHDLQEPLRKIKLFSNALATKFKQNIDDEMSSYLQKIVNASDRMQMLIRDLLEFSRQNSLERDFVMTDLNTVLQQVLTDMEAEIQAKKAVVQLSQLPALSAIPGQMYQLFQNLIGNALKYSKQEMAPVIRIHAESSDAPKAAGGSNSAGKFYRLFVQDNGIGFKPEYAEEIFMVFKRLHSHHEVEGTGVGLAICKKIVELHQGFIHAESEPDKGATFVIDLPLLEASRPVAVETKVTVTHLSN
jgi:signal transduction histidine kinase